MATNKMANQNVRDEEDVCVCTTIESLKKQCVVPIN
jgi:hypothetical protein